MSGQQAQGSDSYSCIFAGGVDTIAYAIFNQPSQADAHRSPWETLMHLQQIPDIGGSCTGSLNAWQCGNSCPYAMEDGVVANM